MDSSLKSNLWTQFSMIWKSGALVVFVLCTKTMQIKHSRSQNSRPDQMCSGKFPSWLELIFIWYLSATLLQHTGWMSSEVQISTLKCRKIDPFSDKSPPPFVFKWFSSSWILPYFCWVFTFLALGANSWTLNYMKCHHPLQKNYLFEELCCLPEYGQFHKIINHSNAR